MWTVWNATDGIFATPDSFRTRRNARKFIRSFRRRFVTQGFYRTSGGEHIDPADVELVIEPA